MIRRHFLRSSAAGLALAALGRPIFAQFDFPKKRVGLIGSGWYGKCDLLRLIQVAPVEVVSLCDVDSQMLSAAGDIVASRQLSKKRPRLYSDYREMLAERDLDIVLVDTPDHWHALPTIEAIQGGADVYVQKPTGVDVVESQAMLAAARKYGACCGAGCRLEPRAHICEQHTPFNRSPRHHPGGQAGSHISRRAFLLLSHENTGESARYSATRSFRL